MIATSDNEGPKTRRRVLIVEDEPIIAFDIQYTLAEAGFEIADIAGSLEKALHLARSIDFDAAVLDANLAGVSAGPMAALLTEKGVPFLVVSGYARNQQPIEMRSAPFIPKPFDSVKLIGTLHTLLPEPK